MAKPWFYVLALLCAVSLAFSLFWLARPDAAPGAASSAAQYLLKDHGGRLALYRPGETQPLEVYEIYTHLLPQQDVESLVAGIPIQSEEQLDRLLEDFGA